MKKKVRIRWTCSDFVHHEHRTKLGAWICGRFQMIMTKVMIAIGF
jgi:hypothetical protein